MFQHVFTVKTRIPYFTERISKTYKHTFLPLAYSLKNLANVHSQYSISGICVHSDS